MPGAQEILRRTGEHGDLRALRRAAPSQVDTQPRLAIELAQQAVFVLGFERVVVRRERRRGAIQTGEQGLDGVFTIRRAHNERVGADVRRQLLVGGIAVTIG